MLAEQFEDRRFFNTLLVVASLALSAMAVQWGGGAAHLPGPAYVRLFSDLCDFSGLPLEAVARLLDAAFAALLVLNFTRLACVLGADSRLAGWAALLILLFPQLNASRGQMSGDVAWWALLLGSLLPLLRYRHSQRWGDGLAWALCLIGAAAFRGEALIFLAIMPLCNLLDEEPQSVPLRLMSAARLYACIGAPLLPFILVLGRFHLIDAPLSQLFQQVTGGVDAIIQGFGAAAGRYAEQVLGHQGRSMAALSLAAGLIAILLFSVLKNLGVLYSGLLLWGSATRRTRLPQAGRRVHATALLIALMLALGSVAARQYLAVRQLMPLCLLMLLPLPLVLRQLFDQACRAGKRRSFYVMLAAFSLFQCVVVLM